MLWLTTRILLPPCNPGPRPSFYAALPTPAHLLGLSAQFSHLLLSDFQPPAGPGISLVMTVPLLFSSDSVAG